MPTRLFTFGCGALGELGFERGDDVTCRSEATQVEFDLPKADVSCVALGNDHSLALVSGKIFRWGLLTARCKGSEGHASREEGLVMPLPAPLSEWSRDWPGLESSVVAVAAGGSNSYLLTDTGEVFMLGQLRSLGAEPKLQHLFGCPRRSLELQVEKVAAGWRHCLILTKAGTVFAIGEDEHGQCAGNGTGQVALPIPDVQEGAVGVAAGACHSVAWCRLGGVFSWGHGGAGRLGLGGAHNERGPVQVQALSQLKVVLARCGANFTLFVTEPVRSLPHGGTGVRLWSCGGNLYGQLGLGQSGEESPQALVPQVVDFHGECPASRNRGTHGVLAVEGLECGAHHVICLTRPPGQDRLVVWTWGSAVFGQCGRAAGAPDTSKRLAPLPLADFLAPLPLWPVAVAAGRAHSAVLATEPRDPKKTASCFRLAAKAAAPAKGDSAGLRLSKGTTSVVDDFCSRLRCSAGVNERPRRSQSQSSLHLLVQMGEEVRDAFTRPSAAESSGAGGGLGHAPFSRSSSTPALSREPLTGPTPPKRLGGFAAFPRHPRNFQGGWSPSTAFPRHDSAATAAPRRASERFQPKRKVQRGTAEWWAAFPDSSSEEELVRDAPAVPFVPVPAPSARSYAPPVMSLSEQRWSGVHSALHDLESTIANVVKTRENLSFSVADWCEEMPKPRPRLGSNLSQRPDVVHQDPAAATPRTPAGTPANGARGGAIRESIKPLTANAGIQADLCGHGLHEANGGGSRNSEGSQRSSKAEPELKGVASLRRLWESKADSEKRVDGAEERRSREEHGSAQPVQPELSAGHERPAGDPPSRPVPKDAAPFSLGDTSAPESPESPSSLRSRKAEPASMELAGEVQVAAERSPSPSPIPHEAGWETKVEGLRPFSLGASDDGSVSSVDLPLAPSRRNSSAEEATPRRAAVAAAASEVTMARCPSDSGSESSCGEGVVDLLEVRSAGSDSSSI
ncbi:unnamed protein product [Effrenium voratum]|uniref:RCC1-like domain-containing protein n=1 Tax=Effrenium voratum TaxID=2562239 RepID=A0AA36I671_9DINO|nr:unnamed protein product [Effrenium voratum]